MVNATIYFQENSALCDQVAQIQENIVSVKEERKFLLQKLMEYDHDIELQLSRPVSRADGTKKQYKRRSNSEANSEASSKSRGSTVVKKPRTSTPVVKKEVVQTIPVNQQGHPNYPITIGGFTIYNLGKIVWERPAYNTEFHIYPIGYTATRIYSHLKDPEKKCVYTCRILDYGDTPRFEIIPDSDVELAITGDTPDYCHSLLLQCINSQLEFRSIDTRPQGDWFFGLSHPTIANLIANIPNAKKCVNFKGMNKENFVMNKDNDPTLNYEALQRHIAISAYHTVPEIKEEPPDELLDQ